jgi:hypothetical protein
LCYVAAEYGGSINGVSADVTFTYLFSIFGVTLAGLKEEPRNKLLEQQAAVIIACLVHAGWLILVLYEYFHYLCAYPYIAYYYW